MHEGDGAVAGDVAELGGSLGDHATLGGVADDGGGQRVLGLVLERGDQREQLGLVDAVDDDVGDLRLALGQRAGLVHDDRVDAGRGLECGGVLDQHAALGAQAGADHDRGRGGQPQGVGAGDHDDGDGEQQGGLDAGAGPEPRPEGEQAADERDEHQPERGPVGQALPGGLGVLRLLDQLDDLRQGGVGADLGRPDPQRPGGVDRRADHRRPGGLGDGQALPGHHRLVHLGRAVLDDTVDRHLSAGADEERGRRPGPRRWGRRPARRRAGRWPSGARGPSAPGRPRSRPRGRASRTSGRAGRMP